MPTTPHKQKLRPGRKPVEEITKIAKSLGVSRQWAGQILKESEASDGGQEGKDIIALRCKRLEQQIEAAELELAKIRAGDTEKISLREARSALGLFLHYAQVFARRRAEEIAARPHLNDRELYDDMARFADSSHYAAIGSALMTSSPAFAQIWDDVLREGDGRYTRGTRLAEACRDRARDAAKVILGDWETELFTRCQKILDDNIEGHRERLVALGADPDED